MVDAMSGTRVCVWLDPELVARLDALATVDAIDAKRSTVTYLAIKHGIRALELRFKDRPKA